MKRKEVERKEVKWCARVHKEVVVVVRCSVLVLLESVPGLPVMRQGGTATVGAGAPAVHRCAMAALPESLEDHAFQVARPTRGKGNRPCASRSTLVWWLASASAALATPAVLAASSGRQEREDKA